MPQITQTTYSNSDTWSTAASSYSNQMAAATAQATDTFINLANDSHPLSKDSYVLDSGAGTGTLSASLAFRFPGIKITATDVAPAMISTLTARSLPHVETIVMDATQENNSRLGNATFTHALSAFMAQFTPAPDAVVREMVRVTRPGGVVGFATWIDVAINRPWEMACKALDPNYTPVSPFEPGAWGTREGSSAQLDAENALRVAGCENIRSEGVKVHLEFQDWTEYVDYWYTAKNPGMLRMQSPWKGSGGIEAVWETLGSVVRDHFGGGKGFYLEAVCTIGTKRK